jgi:hypothetical protein
MAAWTREEERKFGHSGPIASTIRPWLRDEREFRQAQPQVSCAVRSQGKVNLLVCLKEARSSQRESACA